METGTLPPPEHCIASVIPLSNSNHRVAQTHEQGTQGGRTPPFIHGDQHLLVEYKPFYLCLPDADSLMLQCFVQRRIRNSSDASVTYIMMSRQVLTRRPTGMPHEHEISVT